MAPHIFDKLNISPVRDEAPKVNSSMMSVSFEKLRSTRQTTRRFERLNKEIIEYYCNNKVSSTKQSAVQHFLNSLHMKLHFNENFGSETKIETFGSMGNGMASESSDLDISISIGSEDNYKKDLKVFLLEKLLDPLRVLGCVEIEPILAASVPIVKCKWMDNITKIELEIDISIYNPLAVRNTALLRQYCKWDERLPQLAFYLKKFAKDNGISGANKRFFSSYALAIMLIKFLQEVDVLPCIQEDFRRGNEDVFMAEGFDSYFAEQIIPNWSSNPSNVAELFYGFLEYYSDFDYNMVIKIDQRRFSTQFKKGWPYCGIAVQDPFLYNRNVTGMISRYNFVTIIEVFRDSAERIRRECHGECAPRIITKRATTSQDQSVRVVRKRPCQSPIEFLLNTPPSSPRSEE